MPSTFYVQDGGRFVSTEPTGLGLSDTALHDERGPIGRALQTLLVRDRSAGA